MYCISWLQSKVCKILAWEHEFLCIPKTLTIKNTRRKPYFSQPARNTWARAHQHHRTGLALTTGLRYLGDLAWISQRGLCVSCWTWTASQNTDLRHSPSEAIGKWHTTRALYNFIWEHTKIWSLYNLPNITHPSRSWLTWLTAVSLPTTVLSLLQSLLPIYRHNYVLEMPNHRVVPAFWEKPFQNKPLLP